MPKRTEILADKIRPYHIMGKAKNGLTLFEAEEDRARFVMQMYAANYGKPAINLYRKDIQEASQALLSGKEVPQGFFVKEHGPLVHIFSFVVTKDRYHIGLVPAKAGAIALYMQKLNVGFAKYYNVKHQHKGTVFQGRFKAIALTSPKQLEEAVLYINIKKLMDLGFMHISPSYAYSSFPDLFEGRNSHLVSKESKDTLHKLLGQDLFLDKQKAIQSVLEMIRAEYFDKRVFFAGK